MCCTGAMPVADFPCDTRAKSSLGRTPAPLCFQLARAGMFSDPSEHQGPRRLSWCSKPESSRQKLVNPRVQKQVRYTGGEKKMKKKLYCASPEQRCLLLLSRWHWDQGPGRAFTRAARNLKKSASRAMMWSGDPAEHPCSNTMELGSHAWTLTSVGRRLN